MLITCPVCHQPWLPRPGAEAMPCEACSQAHIEEEGRGLVDAEIEAAGEAVPLREFDAEAVAAELRDRLPSLEATLKEIAEAQKVTRETLDLEFTV